MGITTDIDSSKEEDNKSQRNHSFLFSKKDNSSSSSKNNNNSESVDALKTNQIKKNKKSKIQKKKINSTDTTRRNSNNNGEDNKNNKNGGAITAHKVLKEKKNTNTQDEHVDSSFSKNTVTDKSEEKKKIIKKKKFEKKLKVKMDKKLPIEENKTRVEKKDIDGGNSVERLTNGRNSDTFKKPNVVRKGVEGEVKGEVKGEEGGISRVVHSDAKDIKKNKKKHRADKKEGRERDDDIEKNHADHSIGNDREDITLVEHDASSGHTRGVSSRGRGNARGRGSTRGSTRGGSIRGSTRGRGSIRIGGGGGGSSRSGSRSGSRRSSRSDDFSGTDIYHTPNDYKEYTHDGSNGYTGDLSISNESGKKFKLSQSAPASLLSSDNRTDYQRQDNNNNNIIDDKYGHNHHHHFVNNDVLKPPVTHPTRFQQKSETHIHPSMGFDHIHTTNESHSFPNSMDSSHNHQHQQHQISHYLNNHDPAMHNNGSGHGGRIVNQEDHKIIKESRFFKRSSFSSVQKQDSTPHPFDFPKHQQPTPLYHSQTIPFHHHQQQQHQDHMGFSSHGGNNNSNVQIQPHQHYKPIMNNNTGNTQKQYPLRRKSSNSYNNSMNIKDEFPHIDYKKAAESVFEEEDDDDDDGVEKEGDVGDSHVSNEPVVQEPSVMHESHEDNIQGNEQQQEEEIKDVEEEESKKPFSLDDFLKFDFLANENVWDEEGIDLSRINESVDKLSVNETGNHLKNESTLHAKPKILQRPTEEPYHVYTPNVEIVEMEQQRPKEDQGPPYVVKIAKLQNSFNLNKIKKLILDENQVEYIKYKIFWDMNVDGSLNHKSKVCFFEVTSFNEMVKVISKLSSNKYNYILSKASLPDFKRYMERNHPDNLPLGCKDPDAFVEGVIELYDPITRVRLTEDQIKKIKLAQQASVLAPLSSTASSPTLTSASTTSPPPMISFAEIAAKAKLAQEKNSKPSTSSTQNSPSPMLATKATLNSGVLNFNNSSSTATGSSANSVPNPVSYASLSSSNYTTSNASSHGSSMGNNNFSNRTGGRSHSSKTGYAGRDRERDRERDSDSHSPNKSFGLACSFITGTGNGHNNNNNNNNNNGYKKRR